MKTPSGCERDETLRQAWRDRVRGIATDCFVLVNETGSHTAPARLMGPAPCGAGAMGCVPRNQGTNRTGIASPAFDGLGPELPDRGVNIRGFGVLALTLNLIRTEAGFSKVKPLHGSPRLRPTKHWSGWSVPRSPRSSLRMCVATSRGVATSSRFSSDDCHGENHPM